MTFQEKPRAQSTRIFGGNACYYPAKGLAQTLDVNLGCGKNEHFKHFFGLFREGADNAEAATGMLDRLMLNWPDESDLRGEIKRLEEEGDRITHDILHQLNSTTMT